MSKEDEQDEETPSSIGVGRYPCMPSLVALQQMRNRLHLAYLGKKLMKWTALATGRELRKIALDLNESYEDFHEDLANAYIFLARCRYYYPNLNKMVIEDTQKEAHVSLRTSTKTVSGVKVIQFEIGETDTPPYPHLGIEKGGQCIKDTKQKWKDLLKRMIIMVELRESFASVEYAHKSATKKQNVLSKVIIPRLTITLQYILSELEEREREDNFRLKRFKQLKTKKASVPKIKLCTCCARYFRCDVEAKEPVCEICAKALRLGPSDVPIVYVPCANVGKQLLEYLDTHMDDIKALAKAYPGTTCCTTEGTASCLPPMSLRPPPPPKVETPPKVVTPPPEKIITPPKVTTPPPEPEPPKPEPVALPAPPPPPPPPPPPLPKPVSPHFIFKQRPQMLDFKRPVLKPIGAPKVIKIPLEPCKLVGQPPCSTPPAEKPCKPPCGPAPCGTGPPPPKPCAAPCSFPPEPIVAPCPTPASRLPCSSKASAHAPCPLATKPYIPKPITPCASCQASADKLIEAAQTLNRVVDKLLAYRTPCIAADLSKPCLVRSDTASVQQENRPCGSVHSRDIRLEASCLSFCSLHRLLKPCLQCAATIMPKTAKLLKEIKSSSAKQYPSGDTTHDSSILDKPVSQRSVCPVCPQSLASLKTNITIVTSSDKSASASLCVGSSNSSHQVTPKLSHQSQMRKARRVMKTSNSVEVTEKIIKLKKVRKLDGSVSEEKRIIIRTERTLELRKNNEKNKEDNNGDQPSDDKKKPETADKACNTDFSPCTTFPCPEFPRRSLSLHPPTHLSTPHQFRPAHPCSTSTHKTHDISHKHEPSHLLHHHLATYPPGSMHNFIHKEEPLRPYHDHKAPHSHDATCDACHKFPRGSLSLHPPTHSSTPHQSRPSHPCSTSMHRTHDISHEHEPSHLLHHHLATYPPGSMHNFIHKEEPLRPYHDHKAPHPHDATSELPHLLHHHKAAYPSGSTHDLLLDKGTYPCVCPSETDKEKEILKKIAENVEMTIQRLKDASTSTCSANVNPSITSKSIKSEQVKGATQMYDPRLRSCISEPVPSTSRCEIPETCNSSLSTDNIIFKSKTIQEAKSHIRPKDKKKGSQAIDVCKTDVCDCNKNKSTVNICIHSPKYVTGKSVRQTNADTETIAISIDSGVNEIVVTEPRIVSCKPNKPPQKSQNCCGKVIEDRNPCQLEKNQVNKVKPVTPCQLKYTVVGDNRRPSDVKFEDKTNKPAIKALLKVVGQTIENENQKTKSKFAHIKDSFSQLPYKSSKHAKADETNDKKIRTIERPIENQGYTIDCRKIRSYHAEETSKQDTDTSNTGRSSSANDVRLGERICKNCLMEISGYAPAKTVVKLEDLSNNCKICQIRKETMRKANSNAKNSAVLSESYHSCRSMSLDSDSHICIDLAGSYPSVSKNSCCDEGKKNMKGKCDPVCGSAFTKENKPAKDESKGNTHSTSCTSTHLSEGSKRNFEKFNTLMKRLDEDLERSALLADLYSGVATRVANSLPSVHDPDSCKHNPVNGQTEGATATKSNSFTKTNDNKSDTGKELCESICNIGRALYGRVRANDPTLFAKKESQESNKGEEKPKVKDKMCKCCTAKPFYCNRAPDNCCKSESCVLNIVKLLSTLSTSKPCSIDPSNESKPSSSENSAPETDLSLESYEKPYRDDLASCADAATEIQEKIFRITEKFSEMALDEVSKDIDTYYSMSFENIIKPGGKPCRSAPMATDNITRLYTRSEKPPPTSQIDGRPDNVTGNSASKDATTNTKRSTRYDVRSISNFPSKPGNKISKSSVPSSKITISRTINDSCSCHNMHANSKSPDTRQCKSYEDFHQKKDKNK